MTTILILAGGKSTRMGEDKSAMFGGARRIHDECRKVEVVRIITLCGSSNRLSYFSGEVWADPVDCRGVLDVVKWAIQQVNDDILLVPCDAFNISELGIGRLVLQQNCVPIDGFGNRQPLFARIADPTKLVWSATTLTDLFSEFPSYEDQDICGEFNNFNQHSDLKNLHQR